MSLFGLAHMRSLRMPQSGICMWNLVRLSGSLAATGRQTYIGGPHDPPYLFHGLEIWAQAAVHAEYLLINDRRHRHTVEAVSKTLPESDVVTPLAFVVETM